jgi:hypothetical protein
VRKYFFSDELRDEMRRVYGNGKKRDLTEGLDRLVEKTGWPRFAFKDEATRRGWTNYHRRAWTEREVEYLREKLGVVSVHRIARNLGRSVHSVKGRGKGLRLSWRLREGYNMADLMEVFGARQGKVRRWMERGLLGKVHRHGRETRVRERNVVRFVRRFTTEYDLRRVDQKWFKGMVFGELAQYGDQI